MRVLVVGGAGFLGSHLCERLLGLDHTVICMDNLLTGTGQNIDGFRNDKNFSFLQQDVCDSIDITGNIDWIAHLASPASPIDYQKLPIETLKVGALGTFNLLDLAVQKNAKFLLASTSEVYGEPQMHPQREEYWGNVNPIGVRSVYDEAKRYAEAVTMAYYRKFGLDVKIVRIFNTYGPRMRPDDGRVIPTFITQALRGEPLTIFGDGSQTRSFCYVKDLVEGLVCTLESETHGPVNLGNPSELNMKDLASEIIRLSGSASSLVFKELPQDDPSRRNPNIDRAKNILGWEPKVALQEGLNTTIDWFKTYF
ncbi:SDR family oxidoreductase [SAR202 cluster bacterium AD-802-E10_MRT_200m]|nr:SDR family oxidoreductase [SAR202 cluster bacterium AD-802-E10_MRT_200m]MQF82915.1 SDR family oxidoreductase [SAR202 cluster bacterium AD-802-E10_MRT_200m]